MSESTHYTSTAKTLHWLISLMIFCMLLLGFYMSDLPLSPDKLKFYSWHKWAGVTVFLLVIIRLGWRITHTPPAMPEGMPQLQQVAATIFHFALYALMFLIPLSGWLMSSAKGFQTVWFGVLPIPDLLPKDKAVGDALKEIHQALNLLLIGILIIHVLAALKHHFIDKDNVLKQMLPSRKNVAPEEMNH
jgi:cytochrome b561